MTEWLDKLRLTCKEQYEASTGDDFSQWLHTVCVSRKKSYVKSLIILGK